MSMKYRSCLKISYLLIFVLVSSCSTLLTPSANDGAKQTSLELAVRYVQSALSGNLKGVASDLLIQEYLENQKITAKEYENKVLSLKNRWDISEHPLALLIVKDVNVSGNDSKVKLRRDNLKDKVFPEIRIELFWTGSSWAIVDDNIFGKGEIFDTNRKR